MTHHLKNLGPLGLQYLANLFNHCNISAIWKRAIITTVPKPYKPADFGTSYRYIPFLFPAVKVLEHLLQPELNSLLLSPNQHGLLPNHSTVSALLLLTHNIVQVFNQPGTPLRTSAKAIDLTRLLTSSTTPKLISTRTLSPLSNNTKRRLIPCLKSRTASCQYNFTLSPFFHARVRVHQGACISPALFNFFASTFPQFGNLLTNSYKDDFTVSCSNSNVARVAEALTSDS